MTRRQDIRPALVALAGELFAAGKAVSDLDEAVGAALAGGLPVDLAGLQRLDHLRQMLTDLAAFTARLAETAAGEGDVARAIAAVRLGEVAVRLAGADAGSGEDEFWDV